MALNVEESLLSNHSEERSDSVEYQLRGKFHSVEDHQRFTASHIRNYTIVG